MDRNPSGSAVDASKDEDHHCGHASTGGATTVDLSNFAGGVSGVRKLENFLAGGGGRDGVLSTQHSQLGHSLVEAATVVSNPDVSEYDSELKKVAAGFLNGFSSPGNPQKPMQPSLAALNSDSCPKKAVDSFGQRTSIYRGVTR